MEEEIKEKVISKNYIPKVFKGIEKGWFTKGHSKLITNKGERRWENL